MTRFAWNMSDSTSLVGLLFLSLSFSPCRDPVTHEASMSAFAFTLNVLVMASRLLHRKNSQSQQLPKAGTPFIHRKPVAVTHLECSQDFSHIDILLDVVSQNEPTYICQENQENLKAHRTPIRLEIQVQRGIPLPHLRHANAGTPGGSESCQTKS